MIETQIMATLRDGKQLPQLPVESVTIAMMDAEDNLFGIGFNPNADKIILAMYNADNVPLFDTEISVIDFIRGINDLVLKLKQ